MKVLRLLYFAQLRNARGVTEERYRTAAATASDLYDELSREHGFNLHLDQLRVAVNQRFVSSDAHLQEGDTVAFLPPVSGG